MLSILVFYLLLLKMVLTMFGNMHLDYTNFHSHFANEISIKMVYCANVHI